MARSRGVSKRESLPYQPLILRLLHGVSAILVIAALISGFWVYDLFDGRFGKLPLPWVNDIQGIHGTFGKFFWILFPAFALYSLFAGRKRLIQSGSLQQLGQVGRPIWWVSLQRLANTWMLVASLLVIGSGLMMSEEWLPQGQLNHVWYLLHLAAWAIMLASVAIHLLMSAKVGGMPLLLSMASVKVRSPDSPTRWPSRLRQWWNERSR